MLNNLLLNNPASADKLYIEDVFSTYLYNGVDNYQTITNDIDILGKGGLVWLKSRNNVDNNRLSDTARGAGYVLSTNTTAAQYYESAVSANVFYNNGFRTYGQNNWTWSSWTFRKAAKFFDVVTGSGGGTFNHSLGTTPGMILFKLTNGASSWYVYHRSTSTQTLYLNTTGTVSGSGITSVTSTTFTTTAFAGGGDQWVAYLFAHDTTSDGIIQCGSYTGNGSSTGPSINLGWEPQWVMIKSTGFSDWHIFDNMRGMSVGTNDQFLRANLSGVEAGSTNYVDLTATGFNISTTQSAFNSVNTEYIYVAIRRGPMRTPTSGTSVFMPLTWTGTGTNTTITSGITADTYISQARTAGIEPSWFDRLRGPTSVLRSSTSNPQATVSGSLTGFDNNTGVSVGPNNTGAMINFSGYTYAHWIFRRAPSFHDVVCYTGTGTSIWVNHNLGVAPELLIVKPRDAAVDWQVAASSGTTTFRVGDSLAATFILNGTRGWGTTDYNKSTYFNATQFNTATWWDASTSGTTYVAYLFASCPGVSKVGTYTGNGSSQTINCGFAAGARFVMIKRTDSTGDWYVLDTARGIVAGNEKFLRLNSTAAEGDTGDDVDPDNSGFIVNQNAAKLNINASGATYLYLAIA